MRTSCRRWGARGLVVATSCALMCFVGCSSSDDGGPGPVGEPHMELTTIFNSADYTVYTVHPDWSPDDGQVIYAGARMGFEGAHVFRVAASAGSTPVAVTDPDSSEWEAWGYTPSCLANGNITYYLGWFSDDHDMHIMSALPNTVELDPAPVALLTFNGSDVGWDPGAAMSPEAMTLAGDGTRAVCKWGTLYTMNWSSGTLVVNPLTALGNECFDPVVSRDGTRIVYWTAGFHVAWVPFEGGTPDTLGDGAYPSFSGDSDVIGYVNQALDAYVVHDLAAGTSVSYAIDGASAIQMTSLSWDGTKVAFRTFGGTSTGLMMGTLVP